MQTELILETTLTILHKTELIYPVENLVQLDQAQQLENLIQLDPVHQLENQAQLDLAHQLENLQQLDLVHQIENQVQLNQVDQLENLRQLDVAQVVSLLILDLVQVAAEVVALVGVHQDHLLVLQVQNHLEEINLTITI